MPPANDLFANAQIIAGLSGQVSGDSTGATSEPGELTVTGGDVKSVWFKWTSPASGDVTFDTFQSVPGFDTTLAVHLDATSVLAQNDDFSGHGLLSSVTFVAFKNTNYWIRVAGFGGAEGAFVLSWSTNNVTDDVGVGSEGDAVSLLRPGLTVGTLGFQRFNGALNLSESARILRWSGTRWDDITYNLKPIDTVCGLVFWKGHLYASVVDTYSVDTHVWRLNGIKWERIYVHSQSGAYGQGALVVYRDALYMGGPGAFPRTADYRWRGDVSASDVLMEEIHEIPWVARPTAPHDVDYQPQVSVQSQIYQIRPPVEVSGQVGHAYTTDIHRCHLYTVQGNPATCTAIMRLSTGDDPLGGAGFVFRWSDPKNYWTATLNWIPLLGKVVLNVRKFVDGQLALTSTSDTIIPLGPDSLVTLELVLDGSTILVQGIANASIDDDFNQDVDHHGIVIEYSTSARVYQFSTSRNQRPILGMEIARWDGDVTHLGQVGIDRAEGTFAPSRMLVTSLSGSDEIVLGESGYDAWLTYSPEEGLVMRDQNDGSCVFALAEHEGLLHSGNEYGWTYISTDGRKWTDFQRPDVQSPHGPLDLDFHRIYEDISGRRDVVIDSTNQWPDDAIWALFVLDGTLWAATCNNGTDGPVVPCQIRAWNGVTFKDNSRVAVSIATQHFGQGFVEGMTDRHVAYVSTGQSFYEFGGSAPARVDESRLYVFNGTTLVDASPDASTQPQFPGGSVLPASIRFDAGIQRMCFSGCPPRSSLSASTPELRVGAGDALRIVQAPSGGAMSAEGRARCASCDEKQTGRKTLRVASRQVR